MIQGTNEATCRAVRTVWFIDDWLLSLRGGRRVWWAPLWTSALSGTMSVVRSCVRIIRRS